MGFSRRNLLKGGLAGLGYYSTAPFVPDWIVRSANAIQDLTGNDRILVIVQLEGGNDGLNTVVPYTDPLYVDPSPTALRVKLQLPVPSLHAIDALNALNPQLPDLASWFGSGNLAILHNVGYPNPDLSHFVSTDYWQQGTIPSGPISDERGWLGRFFDLTCTGMPNVDPLTMAGVGQSKIPGTLAANTYTSPAIEDISTYIINGGVSTSPTLKAARINAIHALNDVATFDPVIDYIQKTENAAEASIAAVQSISYTPPVTYPNSKLGRDLRLCAQLIHTAGVTPRVLHVRQSGYDTHSNQVGSSNPLTGDHATLLGVLNGALHAFMSDLQMTGELDRVLIMTFSEFGRRVAENSSFGTDHGTASSLFVLGGAPLIGGVYGGQPDLVHLQKGNLIQTIDFRNVYAEIIQRWFGGNPAPVLGQTFPPIGFLPAVVQSAADRRWMAYR